MNQRKFFAILLAVAASATARADQAWQLTPALRQKCVSVLRQGLPGEAFWPAMHAAVFAGEAGMTDAVPFLIRQLEDENLDARIRAAGALLALDRQPKTGSKRP
ncbi:HEAT repeat domain-containing protein [Stieleria mannarensis]|uniref:HEAT repeat domain-containing protein n=1 Tax=Stieleria mannarensis TaxID=2755585 RepID=UPI001601EB0B|nr:HEAT repeat domain-containing protein [Rhodopirellula sp. JC639]